MTENLILKAIKSTIQVTLLIAITIFSIIGIIELTIITKNFILGIGLTFILCIIIMFLMIYSSYKEDAKRSEEKCQQELKK